MADISKELLDSLTTTELPRLVEITNSENVPFPSFDNEIAFELGLYVRAQAKKLFPDSPVLVDVTLSNGQCCFRGASNNGCVLDNDQWIQRKKNTALRFGHSTYYMRTKKGEATPEQRFFISSQEYAFHGGAIPIYLEDTSYLVACLTCSGLKQEEDHYLGLLCLKEFNRYLRNTK